MYYIQYKLRESDQHFTMSGVETFWVEEGHLVIVQKDIKHKTTLKLIDLEYFYLTK